jgi:hypothetical protein
MSGLTSSKVAIFGGAVQTVDLYLTMPYLAAAGKTMKFDSVKRSFV